MHIDTTFLPLAPAKVLVNPEPIPCDLRHYAPFGGSFHCATLDVRRRGTLQSYVDRLLRGVPVGKCSMIYHVVTSAEWAGWDARPDAPYAPASLAEDGFVHCSPDEKTTLAVVNAYLRSAPRPLLVLLLAEERLTSRLAFESAAPTPPPGVDEDVLFPHLYGPVDREAVDRTLEVVWDEDGRATGLKNRS